jgi:transcriptional regulator with XRE-family HTH domain
VPTDALPDWIQQHRWAVGERIRDHRRAAGLSQVQLADRAGIDHKTISRAENGVFAVSIDQLARLARALGISSAELLPGRAD